MNNKKKQVLIGLLIIIIIISIPIGYKLLNERQETTTKDVEPKSSLSILEEYSDEGVNVLKNNYTTTEEMDFALKNIGKNIYDLKLKDYEGKTFKFSKMKGKKFIIEVSQSGCSSCKIAEPIVNNILKDREDVELIPLFLNSTKESIDEYYNELNIEKPKNLLIDEEKITKEMFGLTLTPTYLFVDEIGNISLVREGFIDMEFFTDDLGTAYKETKIYEYKNNPTE